MDTETERNAVKYLLISLGYGFFDVEPPKDMTSEIINLLKLRDGRLAKAIPFIFYKSMPHGMAAENMHGINLAKFEALAKSENIEEDVFAICFITLQVFRQTNTSPLWQDRLSSFIEDEGRRAKKFAMIKIYNLNNDAAIPAPSGMNLEELEMFRQKTGYLLNGLRDYVEEFEMQRRMEQGRKKPEFMEAISKEKEIFTRLALAELFTSRQVEIIYKVMGGRKLTPSEYVYYSRTIKKKLAAITKANEFAMVALGKKPARA